MYDPGFQPARRSYETKAKFMSKKRREDDSRGNYVTEVTFHNRMPIKLILIRRMTIEIEKSITIPGSNDISMLEMAIRNLRYPKNYIAFINQQNFEMVESIALNNVVKQS